MFSAVEIISKIESGQLTALEVTQACLDAIEATDSKIMAWEYINREAVIKRAVELDAHQFAGRRIGRLHGVPVGIKDIIDIADSPTACGSPILRDRIPENSARIVQLLEAEGAVIMGKTVTTEFAFMSPSKTRNPHNLDYSPGGSSAGSAAAIAAGHVPVAIGSQTNGSVIRPASFCGIFGLKPSAGIIPRVGVLETSDLLDQIGAFANTIDDLALICDVLADYDACDPQSFVMPRPDFHRAINSSNRDQKSIAWIMFDYMDELDADTLAGFEQIKSALRSTVQEIDARQSTASLLAAHKTIHETQLFQNLGSYVKTDRKHLSAPVLEALERASSITHAEYNTAIKVRDEAIEFFENLLLEFDAIITPAALGEAPLLSEQTTGNPVCCTIWSLIGVPCITLPVLSGANGLPIGVQLVGKYANDEHLIETSKWFLDILG